MTITYSIDHLVTTTEAVNVEVADKSNLVLQATSTDPKTGELSSTYVIANGDVAFPATVTYRNAVQKRGANLVRRLSMSFDTWAVKADSVSGVDERKPINCTISMIVPAEMTIEVADADDLLGNAFSFFYADVNAGARDTAWLAKLLFGIPQVK